MRPILLTMQYFGSYAEKQTIDFEQLGTNGLYLITGDTGSGKTTIFDAILYALYGSMSGEYRGKDTLRSSFAKETDKTEVTLRFKFAGKVYTVCRSMNYMRPKERGTGLTPESGKTTLTFSDGKDPVENGDADKKIIEILGINQQQFSQIAMIAQGDFMKLLMADTSERLELFRKIFKTEKYKTLQDRVRQLFKDADTKYTEAKTAIHTIVNGAQCAEGSDYQAPLKQAQDSKRFTSVEEMVTIIRNIMGEDGEALRQLIEARENQMEIITLCNTNLKIIENYDNAKKRLPGQEQEQDRLGKLKAQQETALSDAQKETKQIELLSNQALLLEENLGDYQSLDTQRRNLKKAELEIEKQQGAQTQNAKAFAQLEKDKERLLEEQKTLGEPEVEWQQLEAERKRLAQYKLDLSKLVNNRRSLALEQGKYRMLNTQAEDAEKLFISKRNLFYAAQAGILAETLEEGQPCPVCGATHHPSKAQKAETAPTKAELDQLEQSAKDERKKANAQSDKCGTLKGSVDTETARLKDMGWKAEDSEQESLSRQIQTIEGQLRQLETKVTRKKALPGELENIEQRRQKLESEKMTVSNLLTEAEGAKKAAFEQIRALEPKCPYANADAARTAIEQLRKKAKDLQDIIDNAQKALTDTEKRISAITATISELRTTLENVLTLDKEEETAKKEAAEREIKTHLKPLIDAIQTRNSNNDLAVNRLEGQAAAIKDIEARHQWLKNLDDTVSGQLNGKGKIMLETYVQAMYFERIIRQANLRLLKMTNNQFELRRKKEAPNNTKQSGLDLDVIDHHSGSTRTVKGLSGGESFMASLSLALGLSDEIQASAGGIHLDTMFVDEGFGSLDEESRIQARNTLQQLSLDGNRLIGIISHVPELKTIEKQIQVKKNVNGESSAKVVIS